MSGGAWLWLAYMAGLVGIGLSRWNPYRGDRS